MQASVTFILATCLAGALGVDWVPKFADSSKGWVDCGVKTIHMEEVKWVSGNCSATVTDFYRSYCEGKHNCDLRTITPQNFGCHHEGRPTLYYTSTCMESFPYLSVSAIQGSNQHIECGEDQVIFIHNANYTFGECFYNVHVSVEGLCGRKHSCDLNPASYGKSVWYTYDNYYGVKCPGGNRVLNVDYSCRTPSTEFPEFFAVAPQTEAINLVCGLNQRIYVKRAYYGYGDAQDDVTWTVRGICSRQTFNKCTYTPNIPEFSDYDGYWDYNTVHYYCSNELVNTGTQYQYFGEGEKVNFGCQNGNVLAIEGAYYGIGGYQADVSVVVRSQCHNQYNCFFTADNGLFLDPRGGPKHLTIGYTCRPRQWNDYTYVTVNHDQLGTIDCQGQYIYIGEAFYGGGYIQEDVTANRVWDRCESRYAQPFPVSYCVFGARDLYFGTVPVGKLTVGYYCTPHIHSDGWPRRTRRYLYGTGENRDGSYQTEYF